MLDAKKCENDLVAIRGTRRHGMGVQMCYCCDIHVIAEVLNSVNEREEIAKGCLYRNTFFVTDYYGGKQARF